MSGYTKGPWVVRFRTGHNGRIRCYRVGPPELADAKHGGICLYDDATSLNPHPVGEQEANAHLIAAAPALYEALKHVKAHASGLSPDEWKMIDAALSAASPKENGNG